MTQATGLTQIQFQELLSAFRAEMRLKSQFLAEPQTKISEKGFDDVVINLANSLLSGGGFPLKSEGYECTYLRRGSTPGGLLEIVGGAQLKGPFGPGESFRGYFKSGDLVLKLSPGSVAAGTALLRVATNPQISWRESPVEVPVAPVALLGGLTAAGVVTYQNVLEDVVPTGAAASLAGAFNIGGWRRVLVLIRGAATLTSFQLNPFYQVPNGTIWFDEGTEMITVPDSTPTASTVLRMVPIELSQAQGSCYLAIRNLLPAPLADLDFCVLGVG